MRLDEATVLLDVIDRSETLDSRDDFEVKFEMRSFSKAFSFLSPSISFSDAINC